MCRIKRALWLALIGTFLFWMTPQRPLQAFDEDQLQGPLVVTNLPDDSGFLIVDLATDLQRTLTFGDGQHILGGFSPDGCEITFSLERIPGNHDLFAARLDGSGLRQLVVIGRMAAQHYRILESTWSPDGTRIAFTFIRYYDPPDDDPRRESHIAWVPLEGGSPNFYSVSGSEYQPQWSPDGSTLVYVSEQPIPDAEPVGEDEEPPKQPELWILAADNSNKYRLTDFLDGGIFNPRWSPDGKALAFIYAPYANSHRLMTMALDGTWGPSSLNHQLVTILDYVWQPNGQGLMVAIQGLQEIPQNVLWSFPLGRIADEAATLLFEDMYYLDFPRYSSNGRWLALRQAYELVVYDTEQHTLHSFGLSSLHNSPPLWSPAGFSGEAACSR